MIATLVLVGLGISALLYLGSWTARTTADHERPALAQELRYQPLSLLLAVALVIIGRIARPDHADVLRVGDLSAPVHSLGILGIRDGSPWSSALPYVVLIPLAVTIVVVYMQVLRGADSSTRAMLLPAVAAAVPFSIVNSLTEELIFRVVGIEGLTGVISASTLALLCGAWFGIPHWFGNPGKLPGVLMAGFLGWVMALSIQQTGGIAVAWLIHFAQDVPIITMLLLAAHARRYTAP